jgi:acetyl-CoA carboxylase biotin carboxyl carrier protein
MADLPIKSEIAGNVWKILKAPGDSVAEEEPVLILESMKMEIPVTAPKAGTVKKIHAQEGQPVQEGQVLLELE